MSHPEAPELPPPNDFERNRLALRALEMAGEPFGPMPTEAEPGPRETAFQEFDFENLSIRIARWESFGTVPQPLIQVTSWLESEELPNNAMLSRDTEYFFLYEPGEEADGTYSVEVEESLGVDSSKGEPEMYFVLSGEAARIAINETLKISIVPTEMAYGTKRRKVLNKEEKEQIVDLFERAADISFDRDEYENLGKLLDHCTQETKVEDNDQT